MKLGLRDPKEQRGPWHATVLHQWWLTAQIRRPMLCTDIAVMICTEG